MKEVDPKSVTVGRIHVTTIYPSLDQRNLARLAKEAYIESEFEVEEVD